ncbi:LppU/SCO3897 family protein [Streptomyces fuscus]|uniref:LppU/SCO3897 family protein n=1 Tax=Streptomyces fuscus TaxID=3048495 RepID=UPI003B009E39
MFFRGTPEVSTPPQGQNPFAQQPGQPPIPQQGAAPYAPVPPAPPARRVNKKVLRIVAFIVVAILIAVGKWYLGKTDAESASVGSCMKNEGTQFKPDLKTVDCSGSDAEYKVVEKFDNTSDDSKCKGVAGAEISYYQTGDGHDVVLCLKQVK